MRVLTATWRPVGLRERVSGLEISENEMSKEGRCKDGEYREEHFFSVMNGRGG